MKQVNYIFSESELEEINRINKIMALRFKKDFDQISLQTFNDILTQNSPSFISENKVVFSCLNTKNLNYLQSLAEKTGIEHSYQYKDPEKILHLEFNLQNSSESQKRMFAFSYFLQQKEDKIEKITLPIVVVTILALLAGLAMIDSNPSNHPEKAKPELKTKSSYSLPSTQHVRE